MKRNRKLTKRYSGLTVHTAWLSALIVVALTTTMIYFIADSRCTQLSQSIGRENLRLEQLKSECVRESARWDGLKTSEKIEAALLHHGLDMDYPKADQIVRMERNGRPCAGQVAVARALARQGKVSHLADARTVRR